MATQDTSFVFDENCDLDENLTAFGNYLEQLDAPLSLDLQACFHSLVDGTYEAEKLWDRFLDICTNPPTSTKTIEPEGQTTNVTGSAPAPAQPSTMQLPTVTGWLLEGVSIEGFRGVNNESEPLDLKFNLAKINSISASNGVGKTSVYDAIRYAITGKVHWLDELPVSERKEDYYKNQFHSTGQSTITLKLVAEPSQKKCEITIVRSSNGQRAITATPPWNGKAILTALNREFVFLDGPTFQDFITAKPINRGRTFSGLLGLNAYSEMRQALASLAHARSFNNHFETGTRDQNKNQAEKTVAESRAAIAKDYEVLVGKPPEAQDLAAAKGKCQQALRQIAPLNPHCEGTEFDDIKIDDCVEALKEAEGGPKRERLGNCIRERSSLAMANHEAPTSERASRLATHATEREEAMGKTAGALMLQLYQVGNKVVAGADWEDQYLCPLCDEKAEHNLADHLSSKLSDFTALEKATTALSKEWIEAGWGNLLQLESLLESSPEKRILALSNTRAEAGTISRADADKLLQFLAMLRERGKDLDETLAAEQLQLEKDLPPSSVEATKKVEAARRLQDNWCKLERSQKVLKEETALEGHVNRLRKFLSDASKAFATAEASMSKARLVAVGPVFKEYFEKMSFHGVEPTVSKKASSEELRIELAQFHSLTNVSPQALLSESFRNAFAISLYLAAASLYGGAPKFIVLDDVTSSFDAGHQYFLVELIRTTFARPGNPAGLQVILLSHDTMLEKLFNKHSSSGIWSHQRLQGSPQTAILPQSGAVNKVRDQTISMLQAGQVDSAKEGVRQYLEYRLSDLISRLRIPVPVDIAFSDSKQLSGNFLEAIDAAVKLHKAANSLVLDQVQQTGLNANMVTIVGNFLSHWGTGQAQAFSASALLGVMANIDKYCDCFTFAPTPDATRIYYRSLSRRQ